ncbi:MAG: pyruvate carboxylase subunit B [Firmicutes bacterium]|nr:pyruvate carboxylase subunit B [Bacillota bacterium]
MARPVGITETLLRDAHQSLLATRLKTADMLEITEYLDRAGFHSLEVWGGATFDASLRFLDEDPWERLRTLRKMLPNSKLQMLLRGQNLVGYRQYPDGVVEAFVQRSIANGIDIIRIFDALNDPRNLECAIRATKKAGGHAQGTVVYTVSPVHDVDGYVELAKTLRDMGADSICIKDMAGLMIPSAAVELITRLKAEVGLPIQLHCHYTSGMASMTYYAAIQAGVDVVDTALSPLAMGTSQPPTESLVAALRSTERESAVDLSVLNKAAEVMRRILADYKVPARTVDTQVLVSQIPGGMLSNLRSQLEQQKLGHKYQEVVEEVPRVRQDLGYPPLVTPMSQIVGVQSLLNVVTGKRYSVKSKELKDYVAGWYGRSPAPIAQELIEAVEGVRITDRPADHLEPMLEKARREIDHCIRQEEDVLTYILYPEVARGFFAKRAARS